MVAHTLVQLAGDDVFVAHTRLVIKLAKFSGFNPLRDERVKADEGFGFLPFAFPSSRVCSPSVSNKPETRIALPSSDVTVIWFSRKPAERL
jgi:hypothetical protein